MLIDGVEESAVQTPPLEEKGGDKGKGDTVQLSKAEHERLLRELNEARESEKFWASRARGGKEPEPEPQAESDDVQVDVPEVTGNEDVDRAIFEDPEKWTDALTKGPAAVGAYIRSLGLVSRSEVVDLASKIASQVADQKIERRVQAMQSDTKLVGDFKDLQDQKSELFKATAPIYQELVRMNGGKQTTALLYAAAKAAKAQLDAAKPARGRDDKGRFSTDDDPYDRYDADERRDRARAQGSDRGRGAAPPDDDAEMLGPEAREICKQMGISEADYLANKKSLDRGRRR